MIIYSASEAPRFIAATHAVMRRKGEVFVLHLNLFEGDKSGDGVCCVFADGQMGGCCTELAARAE